MVCEDLAMMGPLVVVMVNTTGTYEGRKYVNIAACKRYNKHNHDAAMQFHSAQELRGLLIFVSVGRHFEIVHHRLRPERPVMKQRSA